MKCYQCKNNIDDNDFVKIDITKDGAKRKSFRYIHNDCYGKYVNDQEHLAKKMDDWRKWENLYNYVKNEIFKYGQDQHLSKYCVGRLQGIRSGEYHAKKGKNVLLSKDGYQYDVILMTFKVKKGTILDALARVKFKDERHMIDYIMVIILNNINDVHERIKRKKKSDEKISKIKIDNTSFEFKNITKLQKNKVANKLNHLF